MPSPKLVHFTEGGPWHGHVEQEHSKEWCEELADMLAGSNPVARGVCDATPTQINFEVTYGAQS